MVTTDSSRQSAARDTVFQPGFRPRSALIPLALWLGGALAVGLWLARPWLVLCLALALAFGWHLYWLARLERWLRAGPALEPPQARGLWSSVFRGLYRLRRAEWQRKRRIAELLRQFRRASAALPDGVVILNRQNRVMWFNAAARRMIGLQSTQDQGNPIGNVLRHPDLASWLDQAVSRETFSLTSPENDAVHLSLRLVPYAEDQRLLLVRDVTRLRRLERVRQDFVANASHELRTPLTVIAGYLETMSEELPAEWGTVVEEMRGQSRRMQRIVEDMLSLSRLDAATQPAPRSAVDVPQLMEAIKCEAEALDQQQHVLRFDIEAGLGLRGDAQDLRSAFSNLVQNALLYTPEAGTITIRWFGNPQGGARFQVQDNGPGIAARHIPRLTERFYRVSASRSRESGGTGLGLSIVKHVLEMHEAHLDITSELEQGSIFTCIFPPQRVAKHNQNP